MSRRQLSVTTVWENSSIVNKFTNVEQLNQRCAPDELNKSSSFTAIEAMVFSEQLENIHKGLFEANKVNENETKEIEGVKVMSSIATTATDRMNSLDSVVSTPRSSLDSIDTSRRSRRNQPHQTGSGAADWRDRGLTPLPMSSLDQSGGDSERLQHEGNMDRRHSLEETSSPPVAAAYMCLLPLLGNACVDQVTVGHLAISEALVLQFPLSECTLPISGPLVPGARYPPWVYGGLERGIHFFKAAREGPLHSIASMTRIRHPAESVWDIVRQLGCRYIFDRMFAGYTLIDQVNEYTKVARVRMAMRRYLRRQECDLLIVSSERQLGPGRYITASRSTVHPGCSPTPRLPRGDLGLASFIVEPEDGGYTKLTYIVKINIPGLSSQTMEGLIKQQALCISQLKSKFNTR